MKVSDKQMLMLIGAAAVGAGFLWWQGRQVITATVDTAGGILTGNNAITEGTVYEGAGFLGTLGSATNKLLGGVPERLGEGLGLWLADVLHPPPSDIGY